MIRRILAVVLRPVFRLLLRVVPVPDPWERLDIAPQLTLFGSGARHDFGWFLEGESAVAVASLAEMQEWLSGCSYARDEELFQQPDFWQHPRTFEHLRRGDCEDFALWAWRKLVELGYDADLVVGRCVPPARRDSRHAWVMFRHHGEEYLYEPSWGTDPGAIRRVADVRTRYIPEFGVGPDRRRFVFAGWLYFEKNPHLGQPDAA